MANVSEPVKACLKVLNFPKIDAPSKKLRQVVELLSPGKRTTLIHHRVTVHEQKMGVHETFGSRHQNRL